MNKYFTLVLFFLSSHLVNAQCLTDIININTAYNPATNTAIAPGTSTSPALDPHWIVSRATSSIPGAASPGSPAYVISAVGSWATNPSTNPGGWISCLNSNTYATDGAGTAYNMTLSRPFRTCSDDSIKLTLYIANDNYLSVLDVDGSITLGFSQSGASTSYFTSFTTFTQTIYLTAGTHKLNALVNNYNTSSYASSNPSGLDMYGTISSATGINSIVKESDTSCNSYVCGVFPDTVCNQITMADSVTLCDSGFIALSAVVTGPDSIISIRWTPTMGLSDSTILTPSLHTGLTSRWYTLSVESFLYSNLVANGDFSVGNVGFTSSYTYSPPPSSILYEGDYSVYNNPFGVHSGFTSFGDHTTGTGNMMIINGGPTASDIWCETISVTPYTDYVFSAWFANCSSGTTGAYVPILQFKINGSLIGSPDTVRAAPGTWVNFRSTWNSGASTSAAICIYDALTTSGGNDFVVDDISFQKFCTAKDSIYINIVAPDTTTAHFDTTICSAAGSISLTATSGYASYLWSIGSTSASISESAAGAYYVYCNGTCKTLVDTFNLSVIPYSLTTQTSDSDFCFPGTIVLTAPGDYAGYTWQDGSTGTIFASTTPGTFYVDASKNCADLVDTFHVIYSSLSFNLGPDTSVCLNYPITVPVSGKDVSYYWQDGNTSQTYSADHTGTYYVTVHERACVASDTVNVTFINFKQNLPDTFVCKETPFEITLQCNVPDGGNIIWNDGVTTPTRVVRDSGTWWVYITKDQCEILDTVRVTTGYCNCWLNVPSGFTPNNDGLNDVFRPMIQPGCAFSGYEFNIYNRWGELVFSTDSYNKGWDGIFKGQPADIGTYMYSINLFMGVHNEQMVKKGSLTLIR